MELHSRSLADAHSKERSDINKILNSLIPFDIGLFFVNDHFVVYKAYKETAALYAFSAAGVAHAVARACAAGRLRKCHCAEADNEVETRQTWRWGGCGDNLAYGRSFATKFLDSGSIDKARPNNGGKPRPGGTNKDSSKLNKKKKAVRQLFYTHFIHNWDNLLEFHPVKSQNLV